MKPETITAWSAAAQALAALASLVVAIVLVWITHKYMKLTKGILEETSKARAAGEESAKAARSSATAAFESIHLVRQQIEEQAGLGRIIVQAGVASALTAIKYWSEQNVQNLAPTKQLPPTDNLVLENARAIVDHAARMDSDAAQRLSSAFDDMKNARNEIESTREVEPSTARLTGVYGVASGNARKFLMSAHDKLTTVETALFTPHA